MQPPPKCTDSHFVLGNTNQNIISVYRGDFIDKGGEHISDLNKNNIIRKSSLSPGVPEKNHYVTTNNTKLLCWKDSQSNKLDEQTLKNLKLHHFNLGNYKNKNGEITTNQNNYFQQQIEQTAKNEAKIYKNRMRAHSHQFSEANSAAKMMSVYRNEFHKKQFQKARSFKISEEQLENYMIFGNQKVKPESTYNNHYQKKQFIPVLGKHTRKAVILGQHKNTFETTNLTYLTKKPLKKHSFQPQLLNDLKKSHLSFGKIKLPLTKQSQKFRCHTQIDVAQPQIKQIKNPICEQNKFYGNTTNKTELPVRPYSKILLGKKSENMHHFEYGLQKNGYESEFKAKFQLKDVQLKKYNFNEDHLKLGIDNNNYKSSHYSEFNMKDLREAAVKKIDSLGPLKNHYNLGNTNEIQVSVYQDQFRKQQEKRNKIFHKINL